MLVVKVENKNLDKALKVLKGKVIKSRQNEQLKERLEYKSKSQVRRQQIKDAAYRERFKGRS